MQKSLLVFVLFVFALSVRASHFEFVSSSVVTQFDVTANAPYSVTGAITAQGTQIHAELWLSGFLVQDEDIELLATGSVQVKVRWVPEGSKSYPMTANSKWYFEEIKSANSGFPASRPGAQGSGYIKQWGESVPFVSTPFIFQNYFSPGTTDYPFLYEDNINPEHPSVAGFGFTWENGEWIGTANIPIQIRLGCEASLDYVSAMPISGISLDMVLTHVGGLPIQ
jgi:hypothetical protein